MDAYVISRVIGTVKLDQTHQESHDSTLRVTENPIESGAVVADHAVLEPRKLTITGTMVDWLPSGVNQAPPSEIAPRQDTDFLDAIALPAPLKSFTDNTVARAKAVLGPASSYISSGISPMDMARPLAPWLPDFAPADTLDMSSGTLRVEQVFDNLRAIQKSGSPVEIITGSQHYENMLLAAVNMTQNFDGSAELSITAQEIFLVDTQMVSGIKVTGAGGGNMSGRAGAQSMNTKNKGTVQTPEAGGSSKSASKAISDGLGFTAAGGGPGKLTNTITNFFGWSGSK